MLRISLKDLEKIQALPLDTSWSGNMVIEHNGRIITWPYSEFQNVKMEGLFTLSKIVAARAQALEAAGVKAVSMLVELRSNPLNTSLDTAKKNGKRRNNVNQEKQQQG